MGKYRSSVASRCIPLALQNLGVRHKRLIFSVSSTPPRCAMAESITVGKESVPMLSTLHKDLP